MVLANNFEEALIEFNSVKVDYLIAGGYAVIFHGYPRTTGDLDIWIKPSSQNKEKIIQTAKRLKLSDELLEYLSELNFENPFSIKLGEEPLQIDIFKV